MGKESKKEQIEIKRRATEHLRNADRVFKLGDYATSLQEINQALELDPENYYALAFKKRIEEVYTPPAGTPPTPASPVAQTETSAPAPQPPPKTPRTLQRKLAAIMFTDMVGYSALTQKNEALAIELLDTHRKILRPIFPSFGGQEIKTIGDAFLLEYPSVLEAVRCAIAIQKAMTEYNSLADSQHRMELRIGIHLGDVIYQDDDIIGDGVNIAARIHEHAEAGGICVSQDVYNQIRHREGFHSEDMGEVTLKNILLPVHVYKIFSSEEASRKIEEKALETAREEGIQRARKELLEQHFAKIRELRKSGLSDELPAEIIAVLVLDPDNAEARKIQEEVKAERLRAIAKEVEQASIPARETFIEIYRSVLKRAWADGTLTAMKQSLIEKIRGSFQISDADHKTYEREAQLAVYAEAVKNGNDSPEYKEYLKRLRSDMKIPEEEGTKTEPPPASPNVNTFDI
jgi:class 3 adenylate cyclase